MAGANMTDIVIAEKPRRELRKDLPPLPQSMKRLPIDARGFPIPHFVSWVNKAGEPVRDGQGEPDFRVVNPEKIGRCVRGNLCWICGGTMGAYKTFVIGPMCAVNRVSAEPPSHRDCAVFSAKACPFLSKPRMRRNEKELPSQTVSAPGIAIARNPGVTLVWITRSFTPFKADGGQLFRIGPAEAVEWFCEARPATRAEVLSAIESGLPELERAADMEPTTREREQARADLARQVMAAIELAPAFDHSSP